MRAPRTERHGGEEGGSGACGRLGPAGGARSRRGSAGRVWSHAKPQRRKGGNRRGREAGRPWGWRSPYVGKEKDEETGLGYHSARYYASWLGRWCSSDPAGLIDGVGRYAYVGGRPVGSVDGSGLAEDERVCAPDGPVGFDWSAHRSETSPVYRTDTTEIEFEFDPDSPSDPTLPIYADPVVQAIAAGESAIRIPDRRAEVEQIGYQTDEQYEIARAELLSMLDFLVANSPAARELIYFLHEGVSPNFGTADPPTRFTVALFVDQSIPSLGRTAARASVQLSGDGSGDLYLPQKTESERRLEGIPSSSVVVVDPFSHISTLAHELVHAYHIAIGTSDPRTVYFLPRSQGAGRVADSAEELQAVGLGVYSDARFTENRIMLETGLWGTPRGTYGGRVPDGASLPTARWPLEAQRTEVRRGR